MDEGLVSLFEVLKRRFPPLVKILLREGGDRVLSRSRKIELYELTYQDSRRRKKEED